jgi:hypothetical protein
MQATIEVVPDNLLIDIFSYLQRHDIYQVSLVCKRWYGISQHRFFINSQSGEKFYISALLKQVANRTPGFENWNDQIAFVHREIERNKRAKIRANPHKIYLARKTEQIVKHPSPTVRKVAFIPFIILATALLPLTISALGINAIADKTKRALEERKDKKEEKKDLKQIEENKKK